MVGVGHTELIGRIVESAQQRMMKTRQLAVL
jgi:hypothetical protein